MCSRVTCDQCRKPTWRGCGAHVEAVLGDVPHEKRCQCRESAAPRAPASASGGSLWGMLRKPPSSK